MIRESERLGLQWRVIPATVADQTHAIVDGDSVVVDVISFVGLLAANQRVMVQVTQNGGNFVVGTQTVENALFRALRNTTQSIPSGALTAIQWLDVHVDTHTGFNSTNNTRYTARIPGWYQFSGAIGFAGGSSTTRRGAFWAVNGITVDGGGIIHGIGVTSGISIVARTIAYPLDINDYVELQAFQETGGALNTGTGTSCPSIEVRYVRPLVPENL